jgi:sarcosine oxidase, subunit beta
LIKRVSVLQTAPLPLCLDQVFGVANADCAGRQEISGRLRFTTGLGPWLGGPDCWKALQPSHDDLTLPIERVQPILPILKDQPHQASWGGLIDLTPDALPVIDAPLEPAGLVVAAGFSGHGFCLGPVGGLVLSDFLLVRHGMISLLLLSPDFATPLPPKQCSHCMVRLLAIKLSLSRTKPPREAESHVPSAGGTGCG